MLRRHPLSRNRHINCLLYADDIALIVRSPAEMTLLLEIAQSDSELRGYRFSPTKCVLLLAFILDSGRAVCERNVYNSELLIVLVSFLIYLP